MHKIRYFLEGSAFGVCAAMGRYMRIPTSYVRLYFIYISCLTFGSPVLLYLFLAFWMNARHYFRQAHNLIRKT